MCFHGSSGNYDVKIDIELLEKFRMERFLHLAAFRRIFPSHAISASQAIVGIRRCHSFGN